MMCKIVILMNLTSFTQRQLFTSRFVVELVRAHTIHLFPISGFRSTPRYWIHYFCCFRKFVTTIYVQVHSMGYVVIKTQNSNQFRMQLSLIKYYKNIIKTTPLILVCVKYLMFDKRLITPGEYGTTKQLYFTSYLQLLSHKIKDRTVQQQFSFVLTP